MPIAKLTEGKGTIVPDWNLSPAALKKAKEAFRSSAAAIAAAQPAAPKAKKKAGKKAATKKALTGRASSASAAAISPHIAIKRSDLIFSKAKFKLRWEHLFIFPRRRKNQKNMTPTEWSVFISAINTIASAGAQAPRFQDFVNVHVSSMDENNHAAHSWGVHTMRDDDGNIIHAGTNFLAWHREFLSKMEARLQLVNPSIMIPYWDWINDRTIPPELSNPSDLRAWGISRNFSASGLPDQSDINTVNSNTNFTAFQSALESPHGWVHNAVGGTMRFSNSPADPIFWLHHAMVDKIWADWQKTHTTAASKPPNMNDTLKPTPIITRKVSEVVDTTDLGYVYV